MPFGLESPNIFQIPKTTHRHSWKRIIVAACGRQILRRWQGVARLGRKRHHIDDALQSLHSAGWWYGVWSVEGKVNLCLVVYVRTYHKLYNVFRLPAESILSESQHVKLLLPISHRDFSLWHDDTAWVFFATLCWAQNRPKSSGNQLYISMPLDKKPQGSDKLAWQFRNSVCTENVECQCVLVNFAFIHQSFSRIPTQHFMSCGRFQIYWACGVGSAIVVARCRQTLQSADLWRWFSLKR